VRVGLRVLNPIRNKFVDYIFLKLIILRFRDSEKNVTIL